MLSHDVDWMSLEVVRIKFDAIKLTLNVIRIIFDIIGMTSDVIGMTTECHQNIFDFISITLHVIDDRQYHLEDPWTILDVIKSIHRLTPDIRITHDVIGMPLDVD